MSSSNTDVLLHQAIGEIKEANKNIATTMGHIADNLKTLNDNNILHAQKSGGEHQSIIQKLEKYWWLIVILFVVILIIMGYQEAVQYVLPGIQ